jgi:hypothetical protein
MSVRPGALQHQPADAHLQAARMTLSETVSTDRASRADWVALAGGYGVSAREIFASGAPGAHVFATMAIYNDPPTAPPCCTS